MKTPWPIVPLGQAIRHRKEFITIDDLIEYKRCRVQLHAKGIVLRDIVTGATIRTKKQQVCRAGEFLVAEIDAKVGGFGIVPDDLNNAIVSSHYFLYELDEQRLERRFLDYYVRTRLFRDQVEAQGSTNYAAIRPQHVLDYAIPLPPLAEQQRIVTRIDALAARIDAAKGLRAQAVGEVEAVLTASMVRIWRDAAAWASQPIGKLIHLVSGQVDPTHEPYASLPHINGENIEAGTGRLLSNYRSAKDDKVISGKYRFPAGSVLYSKIRPYLRKAVLVPFEGICSADIYAIQGTNPLIEPGFLKYSLISLGFTSYANRLSGRTRIPKLNQKQLVAFELPYPSLEDQRKIVAHLDDLQARVDAVKRLQAETQAELDALLPALLDRAFRGEL